MKIRDDTSLRQVYETCAEDEEALLNFMFEPLNATSSNTAFPLHEVMAHIKTHILEDETVLLKLEKLDDVWEGLQHSVGHVVSGRVK